MLKVKNTIEYTVLQFYFFIEKNWEDLWWKFCQSGNPVIFFIYQIQGLPTFEARRVIYLENHKNIVMSETQ